MAKKDKIKIFYERSARILESSVNGTIQKMQNWSEPVEIVAVQYQFVREPSSFEGNPDNVAFTAMVHVRGESFPKDEE